MQGSQIGLVRNVAFQIHGKLLDRFVLNLMVINPLGAWGHCLTQCLHTKYFRVRRRHLLCSVLHLPIDGRRGGDTLKSKYGDTSCSVFTYLYSFQGGGMFHINSFLM